MNWTPALRGIGKQKDKSRNRGQSTGAGSKWSPIDLNSGHMEIIADTIASCFRETQAGGSNYSSIPNEYGSGDGAIVFGVNDDGTPAKSDLTEVLEIDPATIVDKFKKYTGQHYAGCSIAPSTPGSGEVSVDLSAPIAH